MLIVTDKSGNGMGIGFVDRAQVLGKFTATAVGDPVFVLGEFNASLQGTFVGTCVLERSYDNGGTWRALTALGTSFSFTGPCEEIFEENEPGVMYRWRCTNFTSGTINYRISQ